jgi:hypothetical protein
MKLISWIWRESFSKWDERWSVGDCRGAYNENANGEWKTEINFSLITLFVTRGGLLIK